MNQMQIENEILQLRLQIIRIQEQIAALMPRLGTQDGMLRPIMDGEHVGYLNDLFEHGSKAIDGHQINALTHKAQQAYHQDPSGRIGRDQKAIVQDSTGEWVAVDMYVK